MEIDQDFGGRLYDPKSIVAINDHVSPAKDTATAIQADVLRTWAKKHDLILYDGVCGLCDRFVQFMLDRDSRDHFRFAALQSPVGREAVLRHGGDPDAVSTVYLIEHWGTDAEHARVRGKAALYAINKLGGAWRILGVARFLPAFFLNAGYRGGRYQEQDEQRYRLCH